MQVFTRHPRARWAVPTGAVAAVVASAVIAGQTAGASETLPPLTAQQLLVALQQAQPRALSGQVRDTVNLGLPTLPESGGSARLDLAGLATGTHHWRVWYDGKTSARIALVDGAAESDVIHRSNEVWLWSSADKTATHYLLPPRTTGRTTMPTSPLGDPQSIAKFILAQLNPTTTVTTTSTDRVAGRAAYGLVLTPKSTATKVASVTISIDAGTKLPLAVQIRARGESKPAIDVAYTALTYAAPSPSVFAFTPPPGTDVTTHHVTAPSSKPRTHVNPSPADQPTVRGSGWESVIVGSLKPAGKTGDHQSMQNVLALLPRVSGSWGSGHLLDSTLLSVVVTDDGRFAAGAVQPEQLYAALSSR